MFAVDIDNRHTRGHVKFLLRPSDSRVLGRGVPRCSVNIFTRVTSFAAECGLHGDRGRCVDIRGIIQKRVQDLIRGRAVV